jgi:hypothetical protein
MKPAPFKSDFAILDVKAGRKALAKRMARGEKVRVLIDMVIDRQHGNDDGVSIEFNGTVQSVKQFKRIERPRARKGGTA